MKRGGSNSVGRVAARKHPTEDDASEAIRLALGGIAAGRDVFDLADDLAPLHPKNDTFPGEVLLALAADALELAGATRENAITYEGIRERFLPECEFRGKHDHRASHYALAAAAMICVGIQPGLLDEVIWWPHNDLWRFALFALVIYVRVASERTGEEPATIARRIAAGRHVPLPEET